MCKRCSCTIIFLSFETKDVDPDQTALTEALRLGFTLFLIQSATFRSIYLVNAKGDQSSVVC